MSKERWLEYGKRVIFSLCALMQDLGVEFTLCPKKICSREEAAPGWYHYGCGDESCPKKEEMLFSLMVLSRKKDDRLWDEGRTYHITKIPQEILWPSQTLEQFIDDICHAATCGCAGCRRRIQVYYDRAKTLNR